MANETAELCGHQWIACACTVCVYNGRVSDSKLLGFAILGRSITYLSFIFTLYMKFLFQCYWCWFRLCFKRETVGQELQ